MVKLIGRFFNKRLYKIPDTPIIVSFFVLINPVIWKTLFIMIMYHLVEKKKLKALDISSSNK